MVAGENETASHAGERQRRVTVGNKHNDFQRLYSAAYLVKTKTEAETKSTY